MVKKIIIIKNNKKLKKLILRIFSTSSIIGTTEVQYITTCQQVNKRLEKNPASLHPFLADIPWQASNKI